MLNSGQVNIIKAVSAYINDNYKKTKIPHVYFDELNVKHDSICITTSKDSKPTEKVSDVTGKYYHGVLNLDIVYRVMSTISGDDDLDIIEIVDDIYNFIKSNYKLIVTNNCYIDSISQISGAVLDTVYSGGVKDFRCTFSIDYERKVV